MLALLRPWRNLRELKMANRSWKEEGVAFLERSTKRDRDVIAGLQFYYDSKSAAQSRNEDLNEDEDDDGDINVNDDCDGESVEEEVIFNKLLIEFISLIFLKICSDLLI